MEERENDVEGVEPLHMVLYISIDTKTHEDVFVDLST
jgi:hypothetical protein